MDAARQRLTSPEGIAWVHQRVCEDPLMSRQRLAREVCERFDWRDVLGRPKEMACRKYLLQLQRRGLLQLPLARYQAQPRQRRTRAPLKDAPHLSGTLSELGMIELHAVAGRTAESRRWNALLEGYHPQGSGPLCGAQLRYLIVSSTVGEIGGIAVSAPAWRLAARDRWLGWSDAQRAANLPGMVCNSRFLILPTISVKHLASHVLGLLTRRIAADWQHRYGISPWLMETCVDLERTGTAYRAANWIEVGLTAGRGRQDRHHKEDVPQKRVFLYPLCKTTLERLCGEPAAAEPGWVHQEFAGAELGDCRLQRRLFDLAEAFFAHPTATIAQTLSIAGAKAAYRFFDHEHTTLKALLEPHRLATLSRMRRERVVLLVQDAVSLDLSTRGSEAGTQELRLRTSLAFSAQGLPLGILDAGIVRENDKAAIAAGQEDGWASILEAQHRCPKSRIVAIGDWQGDLLAFFEEALAQKCDYLVRTSGNEAHLQAYVQNVSEAGDVAFPVALQGAQLARTARLSVRFAALATEPNLPLWAVRARERHPPADVAPIDWMLVTTVAVDTVGDALERLAWYARRKGVGVFQAILGRGCRVRQLASQQRREACLAIDMVAAWRKHYLASSGRGTPENSDAERTLPAPGPAHRGTADPEPLHRAHGA